MIDFDDADDFLTMALFTKGGFAVTCVIVAVIFFFVANGNSNECSQKSCPVGTSAKLLSNKCLCVTEAE